MRYPATVKQLMDGSWLARSMGGEAGNVEVSAPTREQALEQLRAEIRYRIEWCPCSGVADDFVELDVREQRDSGWRGSVF